MPIINPLPYIFQNGTTADATQVNADFAQIVANVNINVPALISTKAPVINTYASGIAQTYTTPLNGAVLPLYLKIRLVGGGGGGGEGGAAGSGGVGGNTTWAGGFTANGGAPGSSGGAVSSGGTASGGNILNMKGQDGGVAEFIVTSGFVTAGGQGGNGPFGGGPGLGGAGGYIGSGSGGCGGIAASPATGGSGGGAGGHLESIITSVVATYLYTVGIGGLASTGGGNHGAAGATGKIIVEAHWQ